MSCEHCTDPDWMAFFPTHGLAPHVHTKAAHVFDLSPTHGFTPDDDDPTQGTWWCVQCGDGKPYNAEIVRLDAAGGQSHTSDGLCVADSEK